MARNRFVPDEQTQGLAARDPGAEDQVAAKDLVGEDLQGSRAAEDPPDPTPATSYDPMHRTSARRE